jgi:GST-like protein
MIDLYTWATPNGRKISIMLEEIALPYRVHPVNIGAGEQFAPAYLAINPNGKIPAIVDHEGPGGQPLSLMESGAILLYLADKSAHLLASAGAARYDALQWLMFQMGGVGPMFGQVHHFVRFAKEKIPYAVDRYVTEQKRLYAVLDAHLAQAEYLAGEYSIADIATYPWVARHGWHPLDLAADYPQVKRWFDVISARPAVRRGMAIPA